VNNEKPGLELFAKNSWYAASYWLPSYNRLRTDRSRIGISDVSSLRHQTRSGHFGFVASLRCLLIFRIPTNIIAIPTGSPPVETTMTAAPSAQRPGSKNTDAPSKTCTKPIAKSATA